MCYTCLNEEFLETRPLSNAMTFIWSIMVHSNITNNLS